MKFSQVSEHLLFPTPIWEYQYSDSKIFNDKLCNEILTFDWTAYKHTHSLNFGDDLNTRSEDTFTPLDQAIGIMHILHIAIERATEIAPKYGWNLEKNQLKVEQYWANVNAPLEYNMRHNHAPMFWSTPTGHFLLRYFIFNW
jgi:hypothetical protein